MKILAVAMVLLITSGCSTLLYGSREERIDRKMSGIIGTHKDKMTFARGPAERCSQLSTGEEACLWRETGVYGSDGDVQSWEHRTIVLYDHQGIAKSWSYSGTWGQRNSDNAAYDRRLESILAAQSGSSATPGKAECRMYGYC